MRTIPLLLAIALGAAPAAAAAADRPPPPTKAKPDAAKKPDARPPPPKDGKAPDAKPDAAEAKGDPSAPATPDVPEQAPATAETAKEGEQQLGLGLAAASSKVWVDAARFAFAAVTKIPSTDEKHEQAQLLLGEALRELGLTQAAAEYYFAVVEQRQNTALLPRALAGLETLSRKGVVSEDKLLRGVLVEADVANIPPDVADFLHYQRGLANLRLGDTRWTSYDFAAIRPASYYGHKSRLALAAADVRAGKLDAAMETADAVLADEPTKEIESEARLLKARLLFEGRKPKDAIAEYKKVGKTRAVPGGEVLLERAWSHYHDGAFHDSMGLLYALGAPAHRDLFLPEQYVLRGLIYQRFCHFRAAKGAVADFRERYGKDLAALVAGTPASQVPAVIRAAEERPELASLVRVRKALADEAKLLKARQSDLQGGLGQHLGGVYAMLEARAGASYERGLEVSGRVVAERLLEALEQANLLEYEVGVSIHRRVQDASGKSYGREAEQAVPRSGDDTYYRFDGEYWTDELPDMRFLIQDRCVE